MIKERKSNIELLRIIAMLLIISFHYVYKSEYVFDKLDYNAFIVKTFYFFGELGVNLFILITGYFLVNGKFSMKKLIKLILEVNFYYLFSTFLAYRFNIGSVKNLDIFRDYILIFFPSIFDRFWFITVYMLVYILSPYINILVHNLSKNNYKKLLLILILLWSIIPTIFGILFNSTETLLYYNRFIWLIVMYLVGAYIRLYSIKFFDKKINAVIASLVSFIIMVVGILVIYKYNYAFSLLGTREVAYFWGPNTLPMLVLSVSIFILFINLKINSNKIINLLASTTLGIYMIHDGIFAGFIWNNIFNTKNHLNGKYPISHIIIATFIIFIFGVIVDLIRQFIEKHTVDKFLDSKIYVKLRNTCEKVSNKISDLL